MPALDSKTECLYIFNTGLENKKPFSDDADYTQFISFIREYLTSPSELSSPKQEFVIKGKTYKGIPHQPKNYSGKISLIGYSLVSDKFSLLLKELEKGSKEKFLRSLCTRYAIYYNKKYKQKGSLFAGPYKTKEVNDTDKLVTIAKNLFAEAFNNNGKSSLDKSNTVWIQSSDLLQAFQKSSFSKDYNSFDDYLHKNLRKVVSQETRMQESVLIPDISQKDTEASIDSDENEDLASSKIPAFVGLSFAVFLLLFGFGLRNVQISSAKTITKPKLAETEVKPQVAGASTSNESDYIGEIFSSTKELLKDKGKLKEEAINVIKKLANDSSKNYVVISIPTTIKEVTVRSGPSLNSEVIGSVADGQTYEYFWIENGWYLIKLNDNLAGYISESYIAK